MEKKIHSILRTALVIFVGAFILFSVGKIILFKMGVPAVQKNAGDDSLQVQDEATDEGEESTMEIKTPLPDEIVKSPMTVTGEARGWYFEGVFPMKLLDDSGKEIGQGQAHAQGDWMADALVPFEGKIEFAKPTTKRGTLVLQKDNPSGLPENDAKVEMIVIFEK